MSAAPNGYLNFSSNAGRSSSIPASSQEVNGIQPPARPSSSTAINPNKAAHIGHLRNSALGDTLVEGPSIPGSVEVQNYIDDTGVQVADVVVGFRVIEGKSLDEIREIADSTRFDYCCWVYARVTDWCGDDKERLAVRAAPFTTSSTAATTTRRPPHSSPTGSSAAISRRWRE